jgi:hypothetical protein
MKWILFLCLAVPVFAGCDIKERERAVEKKEAELALRESLLREKELALTEAETRLAQKQKMDSTQADSMYVYNNNILGEWNAKMVCTQTTCSGSAIGDTKLEKWTIYFENSQIVARVAVDDKITRVYIGKALNNTMELSENVEPSNTEPATRIVIRLKKQNEKTLDGQREIIRPNCKIVYSLQLTR